MFVFFVSGNPCPNPEKPFPCRERGCIAMGYVCDDNIDCEDGYDEDTDMCTAGEYENMGIKTGIYNGQSVRSITKGYLLMKDHIYLKN